MEFKHFQFLVGGLFSPGEDGRPRERYAENCTDTLHPLVLAYVGDAYFSLYVRTRLLSFEQNKVRVLHRFGAQIVSAVWQSEAYRALEAMLTDEEREVFRRGRNAKSHAPRSSSVAEYRASTGFEALMGALYLDGKTQRLEQLAAAAFGHIARAMMGAAEEKREEGGETRCR